MDSELLVPGEIRVLSEHIYQLSKGVRKMVLHTISRKHEAEAIRKLEVQGIPYIAQPIGTRCVNLFFGRRECLEAVRTFLGKPLNDLTPEEDFILGALLGYDLSVQCERYCKRRCSECPHLQ